MFCEKCGTVLNDAAKFCSNCGEKVVVSSEIDLKALKCKMCGSPQLSEEGDFYVCKNCGTKYPTSLKVKIEHTGVITSRNDDFDIQLQKAETFVKIGEIEKAIQVYENLINSYPEKAIIYEKIITLLSNDFSGKIRKNKLIVNWYNGDGKEGNIDYGECYYYDDNNSNNEYRNYLISEYNISKFSIKCLVNNGDQSRLDRIKGLSQKMCKVQTDINDEFMYKTNKYIEFRQAIIDYRDYLIEYHYLNQNPNLNPNASLNDLEKQYNKLNKELKSFPTNNKSFFIRSLVFLLAGIGLSVGFYYMSILFNIDISLNNLLRYDAFGHFHFDVVNIVCSILFTIGIGLVVWGFILLICVFLNYINYSDESKAKLEEDIRQIINKMENINKEKSVYEDKMKECARIITDYSLAEPPQSES